ncbi:chromodomain-helicase-DNA-binding protein 8-like protein [Leptotrombidium deliense]|uniref:Chromodomain-helicase-DNA-binding protein 8-like protein n=1 Tax=Leptotrombidium deliense TaxID=299467 RepID=A0A443SDB5_9ACAR|nr:chromodomain-helicase-DNA-binding protein 8-like protein [Leptotrombidium deliense]
MCSPVNNETSINTFEFTEDQNILNTPVKKKGKKRKLKECDQSDLSADNSEKKIKKPKKRKVKGKNDSKDEEEIKSETRSSEILQDQEQTIIQSQSTEFDDATQEDTSQLDFSGGETSAKAKKSKGKEGKTKKPKLKEAKSKLPKKKLPKLALKFGKKKKRKRLGSSDNSDLERTPPPSPDDGDSGILKRRSARNTKRQKYTDDIELELSDDETKLGLKDKSGAPAEGSVLITNLNDDSMVVDKFLGSRMGIREIEPDGDDIGPDAKPQTIEVEEYYVKYKNLSYLHCDWKTEEELEKGDKRISQKIKRFKQKRDNMNMFDFLDDEPFNPEYCEVDRILDVNEVEELIEAGVADEAKSNLEIVTEIKAEDLAEPVNENTSLVINSDSTVETTESAIEGEELNSNVTRDINTDYNESEPVSNDKSEKSALVVSVTENISDENLKQVKKPKIIRHFLVKWRGLPYDECNWELEDDLDPQKIEHFFKFKDPPPRDKWKPKKRPKAGEWKKLEVSPVYKSENTLREYQLEGVNWLTFCWHNNRNCILADEMGLGKTIQSIAFIQEIVKYGISWPFLVIAPLSTIGNWQREFETWTDLNVITYHGSSASRNMLQEYEMYYKDEKGERIDGVYKFQVMITTFEIVLTDCLELREISWRCCIIDEAHRLKNRNCKLLEGLRLLDMEHRVLLTGTPLQNNVEELFSLLNFLEPTQFASSEMFLLEFGDLKTEEQVDKLKALLKPMMLRRLKEDVEKSLAPKEETIIECGDVK